MQKGDEKNTTEKQRWINSVIKTVTTNFNNGNLTSSNRLSNRTWKDKFKILAATHIDSNGTITQKTPLIAKTAKKNEVFIPEIHQNQTDSIHDTSTEIYSNNDGIEQIKAKHPEHNMHIFTVDFKNEYQTDMGANISATNNKSILSNFRQIPARPVTGISSEEEENNTQVSITGIGTLSMVSTNGDKLHIDVHYGKMINGTVISPTAITKQHINKFNGYILEANLDDNTGSLKLIHRYDTSTLDFPIKSHNDLWFHTSINSKPAQYPTSDKTNNKKGSVVQTLSDAAQYELWHQRCGHRGQRTLQILHNHAIGVPSLKGNAFWKCPSCLPNKLAIKIDHSKKNKQVTINPDTRNDDIVLKSTLPGQHFHMDFGFVRGSGFSHETIDGRTVTSIDGFNSYLIVVDRCTRFTWIFLTTTKEPPIQQAQAVLQKFKTTHKHRTVRVDQGKELGLSANFRNMLQEEGYVLEPTGSDSSNQNGIAERPNRTLAEMMRCMLHSANLGPGYWSYALTHAVYILNRMPHSSINKSPYEAMTELKPDLTNLRIFGSRACAKKPGKRPYKLDTHAFNGIFLGYTATSKNVYIKDDKTNKVKIGSHVIFDEAHMSVPTNTAPLAAQALQRLGYHNDESWRKTKHSQNEQK